jgi:hypothetical protein
VAFSSEASNLVPGDTNNRDDVFVHDREGGAPTPTPTSTSMPGPTPTPTLTPTPTPTPVGSIILSAPREFTTAAPLTVHAWVNNPSSQNQSYTVSIQLRKEGATLATQTQTFSISAGSTDWHDFNFGTQAAGTYKFVAELRAEGTLLQTVSKSVAVVLLTDQMQALWASGRLTQAALREFQQAQDIVIDAYVESISGAQWEAIFFFLKRIPVDWVDEIGGAARLADEEISGAAAFIAAKLARLESVLLAPSRAILRNRARQYTDAYLTHHRQSVQEREGEFDDYVKTTTFTWTSWMNSLTEINIEAIKGRVEGHAIERGLLPVPRFFGTTTLWDEGITFESYRRIGVWLSWFGLLVAILVVIYSVVGTCGASLVTTLANLGTLKNLASGVKYITIILLIMIAFVMDSHTERIVAPAITYYHNQGLETLEMAIGSASGTSLDGVEPQLNIDGQRVSFAYALTNTGAQPANPLLQTCLYSIDGRLIDILSAQPHIRAQETATLQNELYLPSGRYRAVTAVHTKNQLELTSNVITFEISHPQVDLALTIAQPQLGLGQTLQAGIDVTNTDVTTGTGELALVVGASDGDNLNVWQINMAAGANYHADFGFVPPSEGSYVLRASVIDEEGDAIAVRDAGYVIGSGAALAINAECQTEYNPGVNVSVIVTATNAGNQAASSTLTLATIDQETARAVYTQTLALNVGAGEQLSNNLIVLPGAQPGSYRVNLFLDDALYRTLFFDVAAEDTLWVTVSPNTFFPTLGEAVTLMAQVMNATYTATDALVNATVVDPDYGVHDLAMTRIETGTYHGTYTPVLSGTYRVTLTADKTNYRGAEGETFFVAEQYSQLFPSIEGSPKAGQTTPLTVTVRNERDLPVPEAAVVLSGTNELLYRQSDSVGVATFWASPKAVVPYEVIIQKMGYAETRMMVDVGPFELYLPTVLKSYSGG